MRHKKGTVFSITPAGTERVLHSFNGADGANPLAGLVDMNGVLYGTTIFGGTYYYGTVFAVTLEGIEHVVYSFASPDGHGRGVDGFYPQAGLTGVNGVLYGTNSNGGSGMGTVFAVTPAGTERWFYIFGSNRSDGGFPLADLTYVGGVLYGTTYYGGRYDYGAIFAITTTGSEHVVHDFETSHNPQAGLIDLNGVLYGTSYGGGEHSGGTLFFQSL